MTNDKQRERLVELLEDAIGEGWRTMCEAIADNLLIEGGIIVPPVKVGQTVYKVVNDKRVKKPYECKVVGIWYADDENANDVHLVRYVNGIFDCSFSVQFKEFGKTVFLTTEEAEAKMKEGVQG
jgi:hypothetical protein